MNSLPPQTITTNRLREMVAALKAARATKAEIAHVEEVGDNLVEEEIIVPEFESDNEQTTDRHGKVITYNDKQNAFILKAGTGESCVLIGAAGTGKTTCMKGTVQELIQSGRAGVLFADGHKHLQSDTPGIVVCAYTRRAVANIRKNMPADMMGNCITIHKLLEYQPVYYEVDDEKTGETRTTMKFEPTRHRFRPLPGTIHTIIFEEASMLGTDLYKEVRDACPHEVQEIFLGDIQQLPPVFGPAILGFKLLELFVVELTEVYRQALESPIIRLAHRILSAKGIPVSEFPEWKVEGKLSFRPWKKKIKADDALNTVAMAFCGNKHVQKDPKLQVSGLHEAGYYDPEEDIILLPFNKQLGTDELNKKIANYLARTRQEMTYQVIAGFNRVHFSINDKVLYDKEDATIIAIESNPAYSGANPARASTTLDYWGFESDRSKINQGDQNLSDQDLDFLLSQHTGADTGDRVRQCSHIITLLMNDSDVEIKVSKASEVNAMLLGYCLTVHKSQGSEWRKVFLIFHQSHATMLQRELLYTAVTRAKEELYIICEPETFVNGIQSQRVKGDTLAEKAEFFKGKLTAGFDLYGDAT